MSKTNDPGSESTGWLVTLRDLILNAITNLWHAARQMWADIGERHEHLMDTDPDYPTALASGSRAVVMVVIDNPDAARIIAAVIADLLRVNEAPPTHPPIRPVEQWRPPTSYRPPSQPLWDRDEWNDD